MNRLELSGRRPGAGSAALRGTRTSTTARSWRSTTGPATSSPTSAAAATTARTSRAGSSSRSTTRRRAFRQPGSAFKPIVYATAFDERGLTPGSLLLDISTDFGGGWTPKNADRLERGPVRVRQALQLSLNLPAIRALERVGNEPVADVAEEPRRPVPERPQGVPAVRPGRRDRHGRDPPDRPDRGVRRPRQRRRPRADPDDPVDRPARTAPRCTGRPSRRATRAISQAERVPRHATSSPATRTRARTASGRRRWRSATARSGAAPARPPSKTGTADNNRDFVGLRLPRAAEEPGRAGARRRGLDGQQRPLGATDVRAADVARRRPARSGTRSSATTRSGWPIADFKAPAERRRGDGSTAGRAAGPARGRARRSPSGSSPGTEPGAKGEIDPAGPAVLAGLRRLDGRPGAGRARPGALGRRRRRAGCAGRGAARASAASTARRPRTGSGRARGAARSSGKCPEKKDKGHGHDKPPKPPKPDRPPPDEAAPDAPPPPDDWPLSRRGVASAPADPPADRSGLTRT